MFPNKCEPLVFDNPRTPHGTWISRIEPISRVRSMVNLLVFRPEPASERISPTIPTRQYLGSCHINNAKKLEYSWSWRTRFSLPNTEKSGFRKIRTLQWSVTAVHLAFSHIFPSLQANTFRFHAVFIWLWMQQCGGSYEELILSGKHRWKDSISTYGSDHCHRTLLCDAGVVSSGIHTKRVGLWVLFSRLGFRVHLLPISVQWRFKWWNKTREIFNEILTKLILIWSVIRITD